MQTIRTYACCPNFAVTNMRYIAFFVLTLTCVSCANRVSQEIKLLDTQESAEVIHINQKKHIMTVEIWSDFVCPFCYIGKRKFEDALAQFDFNDRIEIVWKSYQLNPDIQTQADKNAIQSLSEAKGISLQEATQMSQYVTEMAKYVGLDYNFERILTVNTSNAHRFSHLTKSIGKQNEAEELLFKAYFIDGKNIDDLTVLQEIGNALGLSPEQVTDVFKSDMYSDEVERDIYESRQIGVQGVPFFVFNNRYGVSGAQDAEVFLKTLQKAYEEFTN